MTFNNGPDSRAVKASEVGNQKLVAALQALGTDAAVQAAAARKAAHDARIAAAFQARKARVLDEENAWVAEVLATPDEPAPQPVVPPVAPAPAPQPPAPAAPAPAAPAPQPAAPAVRLSEQDQRAADARDILESMQGNRNPQPAAPAAVEEEGFSPSTAQKWAVVLLLFLIVGGLAWFLTSQVVAGVVAAVVAAVAGWWFLTWWYKRN